MKKRTPECVSGRHERVRRAVRNTHAKAWLAVSLRGEMSVLSCGIASASASVAMAEEEKRNPLNLGEVTVTATRTEQNVDQVPANTTVLTQETSLKTCPDAGRGPVQ